MTLPTSTRKDFRQDIAKQLYKPRHPILSTTTALGTTTTLIDSILSPAAQDVDFVRAWIHIVELVASGPAIGEVARVTNVDFSGSNSVLTVAPAFTNPVQTGTDYEVHYKFHPSYLHDRINEILENLEISYFFPLTLISDGDMEDAAATAFTPNGGAAVAKSTTTVLRGRRSLELNAAAANEYAQTVTVNLPPSTSTLCATDCFITSGGGATLQLIDITNANAVIDSAASVATGWVRLQFTVTTPASCERVALRLVAQTAAENIYFDNAILLPTAQSFFTPPAEIDYAHDFDKLYYYPLGATLGQTGDDQAYKVLEGQSQVWGSFRVERDESGVTPFRIEVLRTPITQPLFIRGDVDFATLANETTTTTAPRDLVVYLALGDIYDDISEEMTELGDERRALDYQALAVKTRKWVNNTYRNFKRQKTKVRGTLT